MPARCTLSPISVQARIRVSADRVSVPGKARCSFDLPTACTGRTRTSRSSGTSGSAAVEIALVDEGVGADRQMRPVLLDRRDGQHRDRRGSCRGSRKSSVVRSSQKRAGIGLLALLTRRLAAIDLDLDLEFGPREAGDDHQGRGRRRRGDERSRTAM